MKEFMSESDQVGIVTNVKEGDLLELGRMLEVPGVENDVIVWQVMEAVETKKGRRVVFHLTYMNAPLGNMVAVLKNGDVIWSGVLMQ